MRMSDDDTPQDVTCSGGLVIKKPGTAMPDKDDDDE